LFGFLVDGNDGPIRSTRQVARYKVSGEYYSPAWIREEQNVVTEAIVTKTDRHANYIHQGWSLSAISTTAPCTTSRIANNNQNPRNGSWITQRSIAQLLIFHIPLEELEPDPEFEWQIRVAMGKPTKFEQYRAIYETLHLW
jgi:hypothetical protein